MNHDLVLLNMYSSYLGMSTMSVPFLLKKCFKYVIIHNLFKIALALQQLLTIVALIVATVIDYGMNYYTIKIIRWEIMNT